MYVYVSPRGIIISMFAKGLGYGWLPGRGIDTESAWNSPRCDKGLTRCSKHIFTDLVSGLRY